jgi:acetylornithine/N-succinyldiaminopimelate aminotransferase
MPLLTACPQTSTLDNTLLQDNAYFEALSQRVLMPNYRPFPITLKKGQGCRVWDVEGNAYLDFMAGIATSSLGHSHPALLKALHQQVDALLHTSNFYGTVASLTLADRLVNLSGMSNVYFGNSGAEAIETALKLAKKWGKHHKNPDAQEIITFTNAFHGRTIGALAVTPQTGYQAPFTPLMEGVQVATLNNLASVDAVLSNKTVAILIEPIQGEGGINGTTPAFLQGLQERCNATNTLLIIDEVQCGMGRTGALFGYQSIAPTLQPDLITLAKGLGAGLPIGAVLANPKTANTFTPGDHGSTFGGNPLSATAANVVLDTLLAAGFLEAVKQKGLQLRQGLLALQQKQPQLITTVRGNGLMQGIELTCNITELSTQLREQGLLAIGAGTNVLRLSPPLIITPQEIEEGLSILETSLQTL